MVVVPLCRHPHGAGRAARLEETPAEELEAMAAAVLSQLPRDDPLQRVCVALTHADEYARLPGPTADERCRALQDRLARLFSPLVQARGVRQQVFAGQPGPARYSVYLFY